MTLRVPARIMIPEEGTTVFCYGVDTRNRQFVAVVGRRSGGTWTLDNNMPFHEVTHWSPMSDELAPVAKQAHRLATVEPRQQSR